MLGQRRAGLCGSSTGRGRWRGKAGKKKRGEGAQAKAEVTGDGVRPFSIERCGPWIRYCNERSTLRSKRESWALLCEQEPPKRRAGAKANKKGASNIKPGRSTITLPPPQQCPRPVRRQASESDKAPPSTRPHVHTGGQHKPHGGRCASRAEAIHPRDAGSSGASTRLVGGLPRNGCAHNNRNGHPNRFAHSFIRSFILILDLLECLRAFSIGRERKKIALMTMMITIAYRRSQQRCPCPAGFTNILQRETPHWALRGSWRNYLKLPKGSAYLARCHFRSRRTAPAPSPLRDMAFPAPHATQCWTLTDRISTTVTIQG